MNALLHARSEAGYNCFGVLLYIQIPLMAITAEEVGIRGLDFDFPYERVIRGAS